MEGLLAYSYLWIYGFCSAQAYHERLDELFSAKPGDARLLELEKCAHRDKDTFARLSGYVEHEANAFDTAMFGKTLFEGLEKAYRSDGCDLEDFGKQCYALWKTLPKFLDHEQPFYTLCYVDEPLPWGKKQNGALLESAFAFYKGAK